MYRRLEIAGGLLIPVAISICALFFAAQNRLVVANATGQTIRVITISVGGKSIVFNNVQSGTSVSASFPIRGDDHFEVRGELADHTNVAADCGYVTNGMWGERAHFTIGTKGNVKFDQGAYRA